MKRRQFTKILPLPQQKDKMQTYVIDMEILHDKRGRRFPKEIAILGTENPVTANWIIKPNCHTKELPRKILKLNRQNTRLIHGIEWEEGESDLDLIEKFLRRLSHTASKIYVASPEDIPYPETIFSCKLTDATKHIPNFDSFYDESQCPLHGMERQGKYSCALNRALRIKTWLKNHEQVYNNSAHHGYDERVDNVYDEVYNHLGTERHPRPYETLI